jgi:hypothetical protein
MLSLITALSLSPAALATTNRVENGSFEQRGAKGAPLGWSESMGAQTGTGGTATLVSWVDEAHDGDVALRLVGQKDTTRWTTLQATPIPVVPGEQLAFGGWMRTENVHKQGRQYTNCNVGLLLQDKRGRMVDGGVRSTGFLGGTHDWTEVRSGTRVPDGVAQVQLFAFCSVSGTAWFDGLFVHSVTTPPWDVQETEHFVFHQQPHAKLSAKERAKNESIYRQMSKKLGADLDTKVQYFRYASNAQKGDLTGDAGNAHVEWPSTVHTLWPVDDHEIVHLLTAQWGETDSALLGEGVAVAMGGTWHGLAVHDWVAENHPERPVPDLGSIVRTADFRRADDAVTYPVAGSFVKWLIDTHGMAKFRSAYAGEGGPAARLQATYGEDLATLQAQWLSAVCG